MKLAVSEDDIWVFVNGRLAIDLGGVHPSLHRELDLDAQASALGLVPGETDPLDLFFAERKMSDSQLTVQMTVAGDGCGVDP